MGFSITGTEFVDADYARFGEQLLSNLRALKKLLARESFGQGESSLGAELEIYVIGENACPLLCNQAILTTADDPALTLELNRFNLEYNSPPLAVNSGVLGQLQEQLGSALMRVGQAACQHHARVVPIGILPTLRPDDFSAETMTDLPRYRALSHGLRRLHQWRKFTINIDGPDPLAMDSDDVTLEGANTSYQLHYRVPPRAFADFFNTIQLFTPLLVALGANSPILMGHRLWHETRIALFKQSVDYRHHEPDKPRHPARVAFGQGWVRESAYELFAEAVSLYPPLIPIDDTEDAVACVLGGEMPQLSALRLHQGCIWPWNRPVYDPNHGGHLRIEMRSLPSGPTPRDMVANTALMLGLAEGLSGEIDKVLPAMPFSYAEGNFYRAAQQGLNARLIWPRRGQSQPQEQAVPDIIREFLPAAERGLQRLGIATEDIDGYLNVIRARLESGTNGATWQLRMLEKLKKSATHREALVGLVECYWRECQHGKPVHEWSDRP